MATLSPINLGQLNRLAASVTVQSNALLTVTPPFLAEGALRLAPEGNFTDFIDVLTGMVPSPVPYIALTVHMPLLKTLPLCALYQAQFQTNTVLGAVTVRPDVSRGSGGLQPFDIQNCGLMNFSELDFGGKQAAFVVSIRGTWYANSSLWSGVANIAIPS
ncbi:MAG: hypothetical protein WA634_07370 [Silvibacterium sp.]